jgi:hypothetical protein
MVTGQSGLRVFWLRLPAREVLQHAEGIVFKSLIDEQHTDEQHTRVAPWYQVYRCALRAVLLTCLGADWEI